LEVSLRVHRWINANLTFTTMGKIEQGVEFTGSVGNFTAYRMRGVDGIIVRKKGGASKKRIKKDRAFKHTRLLNSEFAGRSAGSRRIMKMLHPVKCLADYNIAGPLNALLRPIQVEDKESMLGKRSIILSKHPDLLEGFSLNRNILFESMVRAPLTATVSRETMSAEVNIPALVPDINFKPQGRHPLYAFDIVLGLVPDLFFSGRSYKPSNEKYSDRLRFFLTQSEWFSCLSGSEAMKLVVNYDFVPPDDYFILMLSVGIRYGNPVNGNNVEQVKYAGAAKILRVV